MGPRRRARPFDSGSSSPPSRLWSIVALGIAFTLARFSEAFLILRATAAGLPLALAPSVLILMNVVYALGAYPAGVWSDRARPKTLLLWGSLR